MNSQQQQLTLQTATLTRLSTLGEEAAATPSLSPLKQTIALEREEVH